MRILFLDQSGKLGGAELCLADIAQHFSETSLVGVFQKAPFQTIYASVVSPLVFWQVLPFRLEKTAVWPQASKASVA